MASFNPLAICLWMRYMIKRLIAIVVINFFLQFFFVYLIVSDLRGPRENSLEL